MIVDAHAHDVISNTATCFYAGLYFRISELALIDSTLLYALEILVVIVVWLQHILHLQSQVHQHHVCCCRTTHEILVAAAACDQHGSFTPVMYLRVTPMRSQFVIKLKSKLIIIIVLCCDQLMRYLEITQICYACECVDATTVEYFYALSQSQ